MCVLGARRRVRCPSSASTHVLCLNPEDAWNPQPEDTQVRRRGRSSPKLIMKETFHDPRHLVLQTIEGYQIELDSEPARLEEPNELVFQKDFEQNLEFLGFVVDTVLSVAMSREESEENKAEGACVVEEIGGEVQRVGSSD
ncbi:hypothetical protein NDU88_004261 [Pleurodeles waltl]|uniref:Uncharacterized protein n=1 Tax=Pleurodeles waltl TaxID=8319 RepID=A0AAV7T7B1_PLEWA|nr:hypothetical protein NDU88_004261 [Pleurodeles waltl]